MHGVTGPYARRILVDLLGCPPDSILHAESLPDFGGLHPDPNPIDAAELVAESLRPDSADLLAASDGDGDRNMILGPGFFLSPGDSVAMMLASLRAAARIPQRRTRRRAFDANQPRTRRGCRRTRHPLLRDTDRLAILLQPARSTA